MNSYTAVVLAGGKGTRIAELFPDLPKPLVPVCGKPFLHWVTAWLHIQGIRDVVYSTGYRGEQIQDWVDQAPFGGAMRLRCRKEEQLMGTGGGIINCLDICSDSFLVLNGDSLALTDIAPMIAAVESGSFDGAMIGLSVPDAARYGTLLLDARGQLKEMREKQPGPGIINGGVYFMKRAAFSVFPRIRPVSMEYDVIPDFLGRTMRIAVHICEAPFLDIGTPQSINFAEEFIQRNEQLMIVS